MYGVKSNFGEGQQPCGHCQRGFLSIPLKTARASRTHPFRVHEKLQVFLVRSQLVLNTTTPQSDPLGKTFAVIVLSGGLHLCSQITCPLLSHLGYDSLFFFQEQTSQLQPEDPSQVSLEAITGPGTCRSIDPLPNWSQQEAELDFMPGIGISNLSPQKFHRNFYSWVFMGISQKCKFCLSLQFCLRLSQYKQYPSLDLQLFEILGLSFPHVSDFWHANL